MKNFIKNKLLPEVNGAVSNMEKITSENFSSTVNLNGTVLTIDYADAMIFKSAIYALKSSIEILLAYNLQLTNIPDIFNGDMQDVLRFRKMFEQNSNFLTPEEASRLDAAKQAMIKFIDTYNIGANKLRSRSKISGHFFIVDIADPIEGSNIYLTSDETLKFQNLLLDLKNSLSGPYAWNNTSFPNLLNKTVDLTKFFNSSTPLNLKQLFFDKNYDLYIHDPTLGGILPYNTKFISIDIPLIDGWNLIPIPLVLNNTSIPSVLSQIEGNYKIVWGYDPENGWRHYKPGTNNNTLTNFEPGKGYWIYVKKKPEYYGPLTLEVSGVELPRSINLKKGWNLIAYPGAYPYNTVSEAIKNNDKIKYLWSYTMDGKWLFYSPNYSISLYNPIVHLTKQQAFWVYVSEDTTFEPPKMTEITPKGYEVWAGQNFIMSWDNPNYLYAEPQKWGWKFIARVTQDDPSYENKTINLPQGTKYVMIKMANPLSTPIKIDGIALDGACSYQQCSGSYCWNNSFFIWRINEISDYKIDAYIDNIFWGLPNWLSTSCTDGKYVTINGGTGIVIAKLWWDANTPPINTITIYGIK